MSAHTSDKTIAGRYALQRILGRGAMGVVWHAKDMTLGRDVALKEVELPEPLAAEERAGLRARVMREARAAARLSHPAAVTVFDVVEEDDRPWIVMELVAGPTLDEVVARSGPMSPEDAARVGRDVAGALAAAHRVGIVHRDVKPGNVMVEPGGSAKLTDFGIAALKDDPKITATGLVLGSPSYMAPEQAHTQDSGPPADLWSLGATLYFAVEGRARFDKGGAIPTLTSVIEDDAPPPARAGALAPLIAALMVKDPAARPGIDRVIDDLDAVHRGAAAPVAPAAAVPATPVAPAPVPAPARTPARTKSRRSALPFALGGIVLLGVIVLGIMWMSSRSDVGDESTTRPGPAVETESRPERPAVPVDWVRYEDPTYGWSISMPPEWEVQPESVDSTSVDLRDPATGAYLRVDWTTTPGDSAVAAWEQQSESFGATHAEYVELGVEPARFRDWPAGTWEFTYSESGAALHALDLGFVVDDEYGFALYFQTHEEDWSSSQDELAAFKRSFRPPA